MTSPRWLAPAVEDNVTRSVLAASQDMAAVAFRRHSTLADSDGLFDIKTERQEAGPPDLRGMFAIIVQGRASLI